ncbi:IGHM protein, partial [Anseranas semipalmata]|nr:IGHM protein [Anseranas semipalmata]
FLAASRLLLPLQEGKSRQPFRCRAEHPQGTASVEVGNPGPSFPNAHPTVVTIHPPSHEDFEGPYRNSSLLCQVRGPRRSTDITWLKNGAPVATGVTTTALMADGRGAYITNSWVSVTEADWNAGTVYTCQADGEMRNSSKALECG